LISINVIPALGLKTKLPTSSTAAENHPNERMVITITKDDVIQVDGASFRSLIEVSKIVSDRKLKADGRLSVIINGDEATPLQKLVDVMDVLKSSGVDAMTISAKRK